MAPILLILVGLAAAAGVAWGCDPSVAGWNHGLSIIRTMHRLQWALVGISVLSGMTLVGLVVFGKRRAWWLVALLPVVLLFGWRFSVAADRRSLWVEDQPAFASATQAGWLGGEDAVIGFLIGDQAYAFPTAGLGRTPVVVQNQRMKRALLVWSADAGVATAAEIDRTIRGRDLEIVCAPASVPLIYNRRVGEFFDGLLLRTPSHTSPSGFVERIATTVTTWDTWRDRHPQSLVYQPRWPGGEIQAISSAATAALLATNPPLAVPTESLGAEPQNLSADGVTAVVFRDPESGRVRAFSRRVDEDLFPRFALKKGDSDRGLMVDSDTATVWTRSGIASEGALKGARLEPIIVIDSVPLPVLKFWAPDAVICP